MKPGSSALSLLPLLSVPSFCLSSFIESISASFLLNKLLLTLSCLRLLVVAALVVGPPSISSAASSSSVLLAVLQCSLVFRFFLSFFLCPVYSLEIASCLFQELLITFYTFFSVRKAAPFLKICYSASCRGLGEICFLCSFFHVESWPKRREIYLPSSCLDEGVEDFFGLSLVVPSLSGNRLSHER